MNTKHIVAIGVIVSIAALAGHRQALAQVQAVPTGFMSRGSAQGLLVPGQSIWPKPGDMVTIDSSSLAPVGTDWVDVLPAQDTQLYGVPLNKWFVMTHVETLGGGACINIVEDNQGTTTVKRNGTVLSNSPAGSAISGRGYGFPMGIAFAPGSTVALRNTCAQQASLTLTMTGYLVDA